MDGVDVNNSILPSKGPGKEIVQEFWIELDPSKE